jgi:hypothetical protein
MSPLDPAPLSGAKIPAATLIFFGSYVVFAIGTYG